jgi:hypothetical protein
MWFDNDWVCTGCLALVRAMTTHVYQPGTWGKEMFELKVGCMLGRRRMCLPFDRIQVRLGMFDWLRSKVRSKEEILKMSFAEIKIVQRTLVLLLPGCYYSHRKSNNSSLHVDTTMHSKICFTYLVCELFPWLDWNNLSGDETDTHHLTLDAYNLLLKHSWTLLSYLQDINNKEGHE